MQIKEFTIHDYDKIKPSAVIRSAIFDIDKATQSGINICMGHFFDHQEISKNKTKYICGMGGVVLFGFFDIPVNTEYFNKHLIDCLCPDKKNTVWAFALLFDYISKGKDFIKAISICLEEIFAIKAKDLHKIISTWDGSKYENTLSETKIDELKNDINSLSDLLEKAGH